MAGRCVTCLKAASGPPLRTCSRLRPGRREDLSMLYSVPGASALRIEKRLVVDVTIGFPQQRHRGAQAVLV